MSEPRWLARLTFLGGPSSNQDELYNAMIAIAERRMDKKGLADVLQRQFPRP